MPIADLPKFGCCSTRIRSGISFYVLYDHPFTFNYYDTWMSELWDIVDAATLPDDNISRLYTVNLKGLGSQPSPANIADWGSPEDTEIGFTPAALHGTYASCHYAKYPDATPGGTPGTSSFQVRKFRERHPSITMVCRFDDDLNPSGQTHTMLTDTEFIVMPNLASGFFDFGNHSRDETRADLFTLGDISLEYLNPPTGCDFDP